ncbi:MAG: iron-sulfur cluster assembly protein [Pseudomonadota bacterium]
MTIIDRIRDRVAAIPEPCAFAMGKPTTLGAMGLIEAIEVKAGHATVTLCLTDTACVHFAAMQAYIADVLADMPEITGVTVAQTLTELWTPDRMAGA